MLVFAHHAYITEEKTDANFLADIPISLTFTYAASTKVGHLNPFNKISWSIHSFTPITYVLLKVG